MNTKILVTGSNGFIGSHLVEELVKRKYDVYCLVRKTSNLSYLQGLNVKYIYGDVCHKESLEEAVKDVDYIFHLAAVVRAVEPQIYYKVNQEGTKNLLEACVKFNAQLRKFIFLSSQAVTGPSYTVKNENEACSPITDYGKSKYLAEQEVAKYKNKIPIVTIRPSTVYGPRDKDVYFIFKLANYGIFPIIGDKDRKISVCFVKDLVKVLTSIVEKEFGADINGKTYFIAEEKCYTWGEVGEILSIALKKKLIKIHVGENILFSAAAISERAAKLFSRGQTIFNRQKAHELLGNWACDVSLAKKELGFTAETPLLEGARVTFNWYRENGWL
jgi:nucleoside-diphosphate-sugar epimerase